MNEDKLCKEIEDIIKFSYSGSSDWQDRVIEIRQDLTKLIRDIKNSKYNN